MRLIDADELTYLTLGEDTETPLEFVPTEFIEKAETIEAIPVHWIAMYLNKLKKQKEMEDEFIMTEEAGYGINYSYYYARGIMKMVEEWEEGK